MKCETLAGLHPSRMTSPEGGFYATEDADSEGEEGKFYVWSLAEVKAVLGPERAKTFAYVYDVTEGGNWEEQTILNRPKPLDQAAKLLGIEIETLRADLAADRAKLFAARERRIPPGKDTKVLTAWNGLMLAAMADGSRALRDARYLEAAKKSAAFFLDTMRREDGRLWHGFKDGQTKHNGYLDDYACLIDGLTRLFEATGERRWLTGAIELAEVMIGEFSDRDAGGFFFTGNRHEALIARQKDIHDNATPSGNGMAATAPPAAGGRGGTRGFRGRWGDRHSQAARSVLEQMPTAAGQSLSVLDFLIGPTREFAVVSNGDAAEFAGVLEAIAAKFLPTKVVAPNPGPLVAPIVPLLADRPGRRMGVSRRIFVRTRPATPR